MINKPLLSIEIEIEHNSISRSLCPIAIIIKRKTLLPPLDECRFLVYLVNYSIGRFWIEGLRTDSLMLFDLLRIAQVISLIGIVIGGSGLAWLYWLKRPLPDVDSTRTSADPNL